MWEVCGKVVPFTVLVCPLKSPSIVKSFARHTALNESDSGGFVTWCNYNPKRISVIHVRLVLGWGLTVDKGLFLFLFATVKKP